MKKGTENVMKKRLYWAGAAALALFLLLTGCGMELSDPADGVDNAPGLCTEDSGPALDAVVGTDGLDTAGDEEDGCAAVVPQRAGRNAEIVLEMDVEIVQLAVAHHAGHHGYFLLGILNEWRRCRDGRPRYRRRRGGRHGRYPPRRPGGGPRYFRRGRTAL